MSPHSRSEAAPYSLAEPAADMNATFQIVDGRQRNGRRAPSDLAPTIPVDAFETLFEIGHTVQEDVIDLDQVLALVVRRASQLLQADVAWIALVSDDGLTVKVATNWGATQLDFDDMAVPLGAGLGGVALRERRTIVVEDYSQYTSGTPDYVHQTVLAEGVISVMCAPMMRGPALVGALYAGNRRRTHFRPQHISLFSTIATQVSSAIRHAQMVQELEVRNELLERSFTVHRELTGVGLREAGLDGIAEALARVVERPIVIEQEVIPPFRGEYGRVGKSPFSDDPQHVPIVGGDKYLGQIIVGRANLTELQTLALDHGATVIALELLKQRAARDVEWRLRGELLEDLLEASDQVRLQERAERLGVDVTMPHKVIVFQPADVSLNLGELLGIVRAKAGRRFHNLREPILAVKRGGKVVLALTEACADGEDKLLEDIRSCVAARGGSLLIGVSRLSLDLAAAHREATACVRLAEQSLAVGGVVRSSELGPLRFVLGSTDFAHAHEMVLAELGTLIAHDVRAHAPLLPTLRAYLDADGHQPTVAAKLYVHVSTLKYRLKKIRELVDADLSDPEVAFQLRLAFKLMDLLKALGLELPNSVTE